ncbi:hypothetical protein ACLOJK_029514 [Asimina triloba]
MDGGDRLWEGRSALDGWDLPLMWLLDRSPLELRFSMAGESCGVVKELWSLAAGGRTTLGFVISVDVERAFAVGGSSLDLLEATTDYSCISGDGHEVRGVENR